MDTEILLTKPAGFARGRSARGLMMNPTWPLLGLNQQMDTEILLTKPAG